uniref:subtilisin n=1 Tax=Lotharella globosa TaxID=91324 RepID=A0A7S4DUZ3_9EUKA
MRSDVCKTPQNDQRKLKAHWSYADSRSLEAGHGTHVSGSVAGLVPSEGHPMNKYKGMAFNASIVFSDASNGEGGSVYTPPAINDLWRWGKNMGASISTNSWGDSSNVYSTTSRDMDDFVYDNPEHLILFAAGNAGSGGYGTLGSQANAKNVITVGAASQPQDYQLRSPLNVTRQWNRWMMVQALCNPTPSTQLFQILNDMIRERCGSESDKLFATAAAMNSYYCDTVGDRAQIVDDNWRDFVCNVRTVDGKNCPDKIRDDILKNLIPVMLPEGMTIQVDDACGNNAENALQREVDNGEIGEYYMADFSSRGPTADNRIKPDLVAPGKSVVSAGAATDDESKTCRDQTSFGNQDPRTATGDASPFPGLVDMSGTSMATPLTAGAAALVRQYYREGFAKAGVKDTSAGVVPSAALMKATLIASTIPVQGKVEIETNTGSGCSSNEPCKEYKDANSKTDFVFHYGFGHIQLANALSFQGDSHKLHFAEGSVAEKTMTCYNITFGESTSRGDVRVVLVWTDPFGQPSSSKMLVNDLDLRLHDGDTTVLGNAENKGSNCRDYLNNVESLKRNAAGINSTWTIAVDPALLNVFNANGGQDYALVVVAPNTTEFSAVECPAIKNFQSYECEAGSGGSSDDQLSDEEIAAIVICSVIGFTAIAGVAFGVWWLCCYKDPTKEVKTPKRKKKFPKNKNRKGKKQKIARTQMYSAYPDDCSSS